MSNWDKLTQEEKHALLQVQDELRRPLEGWVFDMNQIWDRHPDCGTHMCIGGRVGYLLGYTAGQTHEWVLSQRKHDGLFKGLFFPSYNTDGMWHHNVTDAVSAIDRFRNGDDDPWAFAHTTPV